MERIAVSVFSEEYADADADADHDADVDVKDSVQPSAPKADMDTM